MKKRNLVIVAFLLVAAMTLGIGYAAMTITLSVSGTTRYSPNDVNSAFGQNIYFVNGSIAEHKTSGDEASDKVLGASNHEATYEVASLTYTGDYVVFDFTIANENMVPATVSFNTNDGSSNVANIYEVTYYFGDDPNALNTSTGSVILSAATRANDGTVTPSASHLKVKVKLIGIPTTSGSNTTLAAISNTYALSLVCVGEATNSASN